MKFSPPKTFVLAFAFLFCSIASAEHSPCDIFWAIQPQNHKSRSVILKRVLPERLEILRERTIVEMASRDDADLPPVAHTENSDVLVGGKRYRLLQLLGKGAEAYVFKAESEGKFFSLKIFREDKFHRSVVNRLERFKQNGVRTPAIYEVDAEQGIVVMEYIHGVPMWAFSKLPSREQILPQSDLNLFKRSFQLWLDEQPRGISTMDANTVLNFADGRLEYVLIDPH